MLLDFLPWAWETGVLFGLDYCQKTKIDEKVEIVFQTDTLHSESQRV